MLTCDKCGAKVIGEPSTITLQNLPVKEGYSYDIKVKAIARWDHASVPNAEYSTIQDYCHDCVLEMAKPLFTEEGIKNSKEYEDTLLYQTMRQVTGT